MTRAVPDPASVLAAYLSEATAQARLAYEFSANSYSYSCLSACLAAEAALGVLREALESEEGACG